MKSIGETHDVFLIMKPYKVFISHGGDDTFIVNKYLKPDVEGSGAEVFLDAGKIKYGDDFREKILSELSACDELMVLFTPSSILRPWVIAEVGATIIRDKRIVPIRYGPTELELQELGIMSLLGTTSMLEMDDFDSYVKQLTERVRESSYE